MRKLFILVLLIMVFVLFNANLKLKVERADLKIKLLDHKMALNLQDTFMESSQRAAFKSGVRTALSKVNSECYFQTNPDFRPNGRPTQPELYMAARLSDGLEVPFKFK